MGLDSSTFFSSSTAVLAKARALGLLLLMAVAVLLLPSAIDPTSTETRYSSIAEISVQPGARDQEPYVAFHAGICRAMDSSDEVPGDPRLRYECHAAWKNKSDFFGGTEVAKHNPVGEWRNALQTVYPGAEPRFATPRVQVMTLPSESRIDWPEMVTILLAVLIAGRIRGSWGSRAGMPWIGIGVGVLATIVMGFIESWSIEAVATPEELALLNGTIDDVLVDGAWVALLFTGITGPIAEELVFRGAGWAILSRVFPAWATLLITSVLFALVHGVFTPMFLTFYVASGLLYGYLRLRYQSIWPAIAAHVANNSLVIASAIWLPPNGA